MAGLQNPFGFRFCRVLSHHQGVNFCLTLMVRLYSLIVEKRPLNRLAGLLKHVINYNEVIHVSSFPEFLIFQRFWTVAQPGRAFFRIRPNSDPANL